jgi:hypothetical protein
MPGFFVSGARVAYSASSSSRGVIGVTGGSRNKQDGQRCDRKVAHGCWASRIL